MGSWIKSTFCSPPGLSLEEAGKKARELTASATSLQNYQQSIATNLAKERAACVKQLGDLRLASNLAATATYASDIKLHVSILHTQSD